MASIRDVAKRAGVAACTVSRVLNGTAAVSPETRDKIEKAMKELDYIRMSLQEGCLSKNLESLPCWCQVSSIRFFPRWQII